jgi:hypothetical protein
MHYLVTINTCLRMILPAVCLGNLVVLFPQSREITRVGSGRSTALGFSLTGTYTRKYRIRLVRSSCG